MQGLYMYIIENDIYLLEARLYMYMHTPITEVHFSRFPIIDFECCCHKAASTCT